MGLHSYLVEPYKYTHEREAFHVIEEQLKNYANEKGEDILLIGNLSCNNEPLDAVIFKRDAITVIEFKDYGGKIVFQENGPWHSEDGTEIKGGSHGNPFRQLRDYKMALVKYLAQKNIFNSVDLGHISGLLFFQRNILFDSETIPGKIKPWFAICDIRNFILKVDQRTSIDINISEIEFQLIEKKLNLRSSKKSDNKDSRQNPSLNSIVSELHNYQHVKELLGKATYIGIDFGTSTTVLSYVYFDENRNSINTRQIPMPFEINGATEENEILPTVIYFDKNLNKIDICDAAKLKKYDGIYGVNYWSSFKMQLGKDEGSSFIDSQLKDNNAIEKILNNKDATRVFFKYLANFAKSYLNNKGVPSDYKFCVSIPASFEANQRQDLYEAIKDAGIEVDSNMFIDEPNAAFLSYLTTEQSNFLPSFHKTFTIVFDFGAGTCDISIIELGEKKDGYYSRNIAISKFEEIGGDNLDDLIARNILFPSLCISASWEINTISDVEYETYFQKKLKPLAEMFKISFSNKINKDPSLKNRNNEISKEEKVIFNFRGEKYIMDEISMNFKDFEKCMDKFINSKSNETIVDAVKSALAKSKLPEDVIDNILFIGGSCWNPYIIEAIMDLFPESNKIVPKNLQTHVSSGTAINCFLNKGLKLNPLTPIISEPISIKTKEGKSVVILEAGTEIPSNGNIVEGFRVSDKDQKAIDIPIYVSGHKLLQTTKIDLQGITLTDCSIKIETSIDENKLILVKVFNEKKLLNSSRIQPFANEALTTYQIEEKKYIREINNLSISEQKFSKTLEIIKLVELHQKERNYIEAFNTLIKYSPDKYASIAYYAAMAGLKDKASYYRKIAYDMCKDGVSTYNYAIEFPQNSEEYEVLMRESALAYDYPCAKVCLGILLKGKGDLDSANKLFQEAFDHLYLNVGGEHKFEDWSYWHLCTCCNHLQKYELKKEIEIAFNARKTNNNGNIHENENLLEYHHSIIKS